MEEERQHQIPQQISAYQFRLVGDMTIHQFFQVAAGAIIALVIYSSNLPGYIKWPIVLVSFLTGVAFAFFPLEDRPLQKWVVLYLKAIYSPTLYVWKQNPNIPDFYQKEEISLPDDPNNQSLTSTSTPPATSDPAATPIPELEKKEQQILEKTNSDSSIPNPQTATMRSIQPVTTKEQQDIHKQTPITVPNTEKVGVEKHKPEQTITPKPEQEDKPEYSITPIATQKSTGIAKQAQFNQDAGPPMPPTTPNVVVGQVLGPNGEIVENAILEIRDTEGRPVRALKSNKLGHFMIVTSLSNGKYEIIIEKEGLKFDKITFEAKGEVIPPIAIWANNGQSQPQKQEEKTNQPTESEKTIYRQGEQQ